MIHIEFEDAEAARAAFNAAIDFLFYQDGYSVEQLRRDLFEPIMEDLVRVAEEVE